MGRDGPGWAGMGSCCRNRGEPHEAGHARKVVKISDDWGETIFTVTEVGRRAYKRSETEVWSAREEGVWGGIEGRRYRVGFIL